ncbi:Putative type I restriction enzyme, HsdR subunit [Clostridium sartagoforme AAU1]|uniref:Putative type I restriction enzyme, HsdR subunit n=1 Tax=Clostridium sartagoforme AAU1 TaxID=1202534 RepID=R9C581_9CLOT|nr:hypothetical protein [Clostridium sartagoforme]EOR24462.1 Putative type I restriction enzyme, HsdR subunit [Clostridium sartagoforme AAU1]
MELFDYLNERDKKGLKIAIGQWLGYKFSNIVKENGLEINFINNIDRMKLAEQFMNERIGRHTFTDFKRWYWGNRDYERYEIENDIAQFIDLKIPKNYYACLKESLGEEYIKGEYKGIDTVDGISFSYEENYKLEEMTLERIQINMNINKTKKYKK